MNRYEPAHIGTSVLVIRVVPSRNIPEHSPTGLCCDLRTPNDSRWAEPPREGRESLVSRGPQRGYLGTTRWYRLLSVLVRIEDSAFDDNPLLRW